MKVALYARCSTKKQDLESQFSKLKEWANEHKHRYGVYGDYAVSGAKNSRSGINLLMRDARDKKFDAVAVVELSRIGRNMQFIYNTVEELSQLDIPVILINQNLEITTKTMQGKLTLWALGISAEVEFMMIQERNARGRQAIKERGVKVGRKPSPVSTEAIHALRDKGYSVRQIAKELGTSVGTVHRRLSSKNGQLRNVPKSSQNSDVFKRETEGVPND